MVFSMTACGAEDSNTDEAAELDQENAENIAANTVNPTTYELDGVVYPFPTSYSELAQNGWSFEHSVDKKPIEAGLTRISIYLKNTQGLEIEVDITNVTDNIIDAEESVITDIRVYTNENVDFKLLPAGLSFDSTKADIEAAGGDPQGYDDRYYWYTDGTKEVAVAVLYDNVHVGYYNIWSNEY